MKSIVNQLFAFGLKDLHNEIIHITFNIKEVFS